MNKKFINPFAAVVKATTARGGDFPTENLFTENNPHGYFSRQQLLEYVSDKSDYQQQKLAMLFEYLANGYKLTSLPIPSEDEYGNSILWATFRPNGNRQSFRLFATDWLVRLLKDYNSGNLHGFQFSPEIMAEELKKAEQ